MPALASELRDRISKTGVKIKILDRTSRKEFLVEPRKFKGSLIHDIPGPLYSAIISPSSLIIGVGDKRKLKIIARDKSKRQLDSGYSVKWYVDEGEGIIDSPDKEFIQFTATDEPGIISVGAIVTQDDRECLAECIITVTKELINKDKSSGSSDGNSKKGLPGYTFQKAPGELWRSRFDTATSLIIINNGHADFIYASKSKTRKLSPTSS